MNRPTYFEIPADNPSQLADFYVQVFGWSKQSWPGEVEYYFMKTGSDSKPGMNGGIMHKGKVKCTINTIEVDNIDAYTDKVSDNGGKIFKAKHHMPDMGYFCWCQDLDDNMFVLMQSEMHKVEEEEPEVSLEKAVLNRPIHFELPSAKPEKLAEFYTKLFGWKAQKWGEMDYWLINTGENEEPGIHGAITTNEAMQCTVNTINVVDIDKYLKKVEQAGGKILTPKDHIDKVGWLAYCLDPEGNQFGIMQMDPDAMMI